MRLSMLPLAIVLSLCPSLAQAGVSIHLNIGLPMAPPLVEVAPGIQVVEGCPEEVFFRDGWYWCRRPEGWYRARSPREGFDRIDARWIPGELMRAPEGFYRNWHHVDQGRWEYEHRHREYGRSPWDYRQDREHFRGRYYPPMQR